MVDLSGQPMLAAIPLWSQYVDFLKWVLDGIAEFAGNGGVAIIIFTIIVKTLLLPLTVKSIRSSKAMQELAPKIKEIQKKHGADRQKASAEQMALYQQYGVNPMAGCLPMLIQIPIFFGVYHAIRDLSGSDAGHWTDGFLWIENLKAADPLHILPIAAGFFQFIQSRMMRPANQKVTDPQQQIMNTMMTFMPLTVVLFGWTFAAGPVLYWVVQAIYSVVQQWFVTGWGSIGEWLPWLPELPEHRRLGYRAPRDPNDMVVMSGEAPQRGRFGTWMQNKMEEAQKNAEARKEQAAGRASTSSRAATATATADGEVIEVEATPTSSKQRSSYENRVKNASRNRTQQAAGPGNGSSTPTVNRPKRKKRS